MKKLYTFGLTAGVALTCAASPLHPVKLPADISSLNSNYTADDIETMAAPVTTYSVTASDLAGPWEFDLADKILTNASGKSDAYFYDATVKEDNTIIFEDPEGKMYPIVAKFDSSTNRMTFERVNLGLFPFSDGEHYVFMEPLLLDQGEKPFSLPYNEVRQGVNITGGQGLLWGVYDNEAGEGDALGYVAGYVIYGGYLLRPIEWEFYSMGSIRENIAYNFYFGDENKTFVDVEIYRHPKFDNVYKIRDAFKYTYEAGRSKNHSGIPDGESPTLVLDGTNPKNVKIEPQYLNIVTTIFYGEYYETTFYYYNYGWYWDYYGNQDISQGYDTSSCATLKTDAEGNVKIFIPALSTPMVDMVMNDASFGSEYDTEVIINSPAGVNDIVGEDDMLSEPEYFNLQGVRVDNPAPGQLVIKKQGAKVTKTISCR